MKSELIFQNSPGYLFLCLVLGVLYASLLYLKRTTFSKKLNYILFILRTIIVGALVLLLINPLLRINKSFIEKPIVVLAVDNSISMDLINSKSTNTTILKEKINKLVSEFKQKEYSIFIHSLNQNESIQDINNLKFNVSNSNISQLLHNLNSVYEGRNLTDVILISDGIVNSGLSPALSEYNFKVHSVGYGDTLQRKDINIQSVVANKIAYFGNKFPIRVEGNASGFKNKEIVILLKNGTQAIERKSIVSKGDDFLFSVEFLVNPAEKGLQYFNIEILPQSGEFSLKNNTKDLYVDVVNGKEKILLVGLTAHPDMKALKSIIAKNELYDLAIRNIQSDDLNQLISEPFDILILHQLPDMYGMANIAVSKLLAKNKPTFFILGNQSNIQDFNKLQKVLTITNTQLGKSDKVSAKFNSDFKQFSVDENKSMSLGQFPPVLSIFGDYSLAPGAEVILNQKLGTLVLGKPLLAVNTNNTRKTAVLTGEGIWKWNLEEIAFTENNIVGEIFNKTLQLLSIKDDKRKLKVYPVSNEFDIDENVIFENEVYNNIFEKIDNQEIHLSISNDKALINEFDYKVSKDNSRFEISNLKPGLYKYTASANVLGKQEISEGRFVIKDASLEYMTLRADFDLLKTLSDKTDGFYCNFDNIDELSRKLNIESRPNLASNVEEMSNLIDLKWIFFMIILLISIEWITRKYNGFY